MKQKRFIFTILGIIFTLAACYNEDDLTPSGNYSTTKFIFPQGNNAWDMDIKEIHDKYSVYLIYKDVTYQDLNRQWQSLGTGSPYTGDSLTNEEVPVYVDFLKNHFFAFISPETAQKTLPVKIYMLANFRKITSGGTGTGGDDTGGTGTGGTGTGGTGTGGTGTGGTGTGGTGTGGTGTGGTGTGGTGTGGTGTGGTGTGGTGTGGTGTGGTGTGGTGTGGTGTGGTGTGGTGTEDPNFVSLKIDGFDYWAISFTDDEIYHPDNYSQKVKRNIFLRIYIENAIRKGIITEPAEFTEGVTYEPNFNTNRPETSNYYLTRGFIDVFRGAYTSSQTPIGTAEYTRPSGEEPDIYPHADFVYYIRAAMWYTPEEFEGLYPSVKYPLIKKRYDIVINYMKNTYGIDIQKIAKGPQK